MYVFGLGDAQETMNYYDYTSECPSCGHEADGEEYMSGCRGCGLKFD